MVYRNGQYFFIYYYVFNVGWDGVVGIATRYRLGDPGIESRWGRDFPHLSGRSWGPPSVLYNGYQVFPGG